MTDNIHNSEKNTTSQHNEQEVSRKPKVGPNIAAIRKPRGISQEYVALKLGKSQQTVSNIELMDEVPEDLLAQIAKILDVTPEYIKNFDLERLMCHNTQIVHEGANAGFNVNEFTSNTTNSLDVIKYIVSENERLHAQIINEKNATIKELKAELKLLKTELKQLMAQKMR